MARRWFARLLPLGFAGLASLAGACAIDGDAPAPARRAIDGVDEADQALADLSAKCTFTSGTGVLALALDDADTALITRASSTLLTINGFPCGAATPSNVKRIDVTQGTSGDQTLILDYSGGVFAPGTAAGPGVTVDLGGETSADALKLVGSSAADSYVFGSAGIAVNADAFVDITAVHVETFVANTVDGNDTLSGHGNAATGGAPFTANLILYGGDGDDSLRGGSGDDVYYGGNGNDTFVGGSAADGADVLNGGAGTDVADYAARTQPLVISIDGAGNDGEAGEADNVEADVETVRGGAGDDTLTGSGNADTLSGGPGNDTLTGGLGNDVVSGDAGDDTLDEGAVTSGADTLNGGAGVDTVTYAARSIAVVVTLDASANDGEAGEADKVATDVERVIGGGGADTLTGSPAADILEGGPGADTISGGGGDDRIRGGAGDDVLSGDAGDDVFDQGAAADGADHIAGGAGVDRVDYAARTNDLTVVMDGVTGSGEAGEGDRIATDVEDLIGGAGLDHLTGNALDNLIEGGAGDDTLDGGAGDDTLDGDAGNDTLDCGTGDADIDLDATTASAIGCEL